MSPALAGGFLTTGLPGKVLNKNFELQVRTKKRFSLLAEGSYKESCRQRRQIILNLPGMPGTGWRQKELILEIIGV